jgi:hypothetical protein
MPIIVMIIVLTGSFHFPGGAPVIQGFQTISACEAAIPDVRKVYDGISKIECIALPSR